MDKSNISLLCYYYYYFIIFILNYILFLQFSSGKTSVQTRLRMMPRVEKMYSFRPNKRLFQLFFFSSQFPGKGVKSWRGRKREKVCYLRIKALEIHTWYWSKRELIQILRDFERENSHAELIHSFTERERNCYQKHLKSDDHSLRGRID